MFYKYQYSDGQLKDERAEPYNIMFLVCKRCISDTKGLENLLLLGGHTNSSTTFKSSVDAFSNRVWLL